MATNTTKQNKERNADYTEILSRISENLERLRETEEHILKNIEKLAKEKSISAEDLMM